MRSIRFLHLGLTIILSVIVGVMYRNNHVLKAKNIDLEKKVDEVTKYKNEISRTNAELRDTVMSWELMDKLDGLDVTKVIKKKCYTFPSIPNSDRAKEVIRNLKIMGDTPLITCMINDSTGSFVLSSQKAVLGYKRGGNLQVDLYTPNLEKRSLIFGNDSEYGYFVFHGVYLDKWIVYSIVTNFDPGHVTTYKIALDDSVPGFYNPIMLERCGFTKGRLGGVFLDFCKTIVNSNKSSYLNIINNRLFVSK